MSCVRLVVGADEVDLASGTLWQHDPVAVGEESLPDGRVCLLAGFADAATAAQVVDSLPDRWAPELAAAPDEATWRDAWRAHATTLTVGRVLLWPSWWVAEPPTHAGVILRLDPGWAFGSGSHPSTRMALAEIDGRLEPGSTVLDMGCGSGVLAIAAVLLGASEALAVDVDPEARRATAANTEANGVGLFVRFADELPGVGQTFDLVLANIGAAVLAGLAPALAGSVVEGGTLVLGGLLVGQVPAVVQTYRAIGNGLAVAATAEEDGWATVVLTRGA